jgi:signal transduction histidine kinase
MIETIGESSAIVISSDLDDVDGVFPPADEITIYRIIQESLNNVVKHSSAGTARVAVRCQEQQVEIVVHDDGQGFAPGATNGKSTDRRGFGLKGIAERVEMLGGTHTIDSGPGRGTTVTVRISLHRARPAPSHHA